MPPKKKKDGPLRLARRRSLSSRFMVVSWSVSVVAVWPAVNVPRSTLSGHRGLPTWRMEMSFLTWNVKRPDFYVELLSVDAWRLVGYCRFVRDEDTLSLKTRSAHRAVQSACERHRNLRTLFLLDSLALVLLLTKGRTRSFLAILRCRLSPFLVFAQSFACFATAVRVITCSSPSTVQLSCQYITVSSHDNTSRESYRPVHYSRNTGPSWATNHCGSCR